ncbi:hypothetical protein COCON_G00069970 [Conger conger]|uniref:Uncharacterized protein n=1 Tax=Conger conger TaxID=82655 RepID=A0A9Q1DTA0_CONCO|nr:hypothetical protein COCON_G00069970 [Conger conger]
MAGAGTHGDQTKRHGGRSRKEPVLFTAADSALVPCQALARVLPHSLLIRRLEPRSRAGGARCGGLGGGVWRRRWGPSALLGRAGGRREGRETGGGQDRYISAAPDDRDFVALQTWCTFLPRTLVTFTFEYCGVLYPVQRLSVIEFTREKWKR